MSKQKLVLSVSYAGVVAVLAATLASPAGAQFFNPSAPPSVGDIPPPNPGWSAQNISNNPAWFAPGRAPPTSPGYGGGWGAGWNNPEGPSNSSGGVGSGSGSGK